jgi:integrase
VDFHPGISRYNYERGLKKNLDAGIINNADAALIREFIEERKATRNISGIRQNVTASALCIFRGYLSVGYTECLPGDVYAAISSLQGSDRSQNTLSTYGIIIKSFLLWLTENGYSKMPSKKIHVIRPLATDSNTTGPDEILSREEIKSLLDACINPRDLALISTLYESGCRAAEVARLKWKDLEFSAHGVKVKIEDQKNQQWRVTYLVQAREPLATWKNASQWSGNENTVFVKRDGGELTYHAFQGIVSRVAKRAGITKRVNLHLFRKSRITHMIQQNYQESIIKKSMWGNENTGMLKTYAVLTDSDIEAEFLDKAGIRRKTELHDPLKPIPCPRCQTVMPAGSAFCGKCGIGLTEEADMDLEEKVRLILNDPESRRLLFGG